MNNRDRILRVLLIMRDAPDTNSNKGGLFPTAIRHHVDLGFDVHVASMTPMTAFHEDMVRSLGAQPYSPSQNMPHGFGIGRLTTIIKRRKAPSSNLTTRKTLSEIRRLISPDVVVGLQSYPTGLISRKIANNLGVRYVTWEHLSSYYTGRPLSVSDEEIAVLFKESHATLAVSPSLGRSISRRFLIASEKIQTLPNPIPTGFVNPPSSGMPRWLEEISSEKQVFASWTSWRKIKRLDVLLHAFHRLCEERDDLILIVAGSIRQEVEEFLENFSKKHPETFKNVRITGRLDRAAVRYLAEAADFCVVSSDFETFGLQVAEAISIGTPVVSTRCGGPQDILADSRLGVLCDKGSVDALSTAMLHILENKASYNPIEIAKIADNLLGDDAIKRKWAHVYDGIKTSNSIRLRQTETKCRP
jgi:glycosyltransferase involved in cell wall biosynthesis